MAKYRGFNNRFNAGELGPDCWDDSDLQQFQHGCALAQNFVPDIAGPLVRRPGFFFQGATDDQTPNGVPCLIEFVRSPEQAFMLEITAAGGFVWQPDGAPHLSGGVQVTFATPWTQAQLPQLRWGQSGAAIYVYCADGSRPQRIRQISDTDWTCDALTFKRGPWQTENGDATSTLTVSGYTGAGLTMTASKAIFTAAAVGSFMRLRSSVNGVQIGAWAPSFQMWYQYQLVLSGGYCYSHLSAVGTTGTHLDTGTNPPIWNAGQGNDGVANYEYIHNGAGIVEITGFTDAQHVTITTITNLPTNGKQVAWSVNGSSGDVCVLQPGVDNPVFGPTSFWAWNAYDDNLGWPTAWPAFDEERLFMAGGANEASTFNTTNINGFDLDTVTLDPEFGSGQVLATDPLRAFAGSNGCRVVWFLPTLLLLCGTTAGEVEIYGATPLDAVQPGSTRARDVTDYGAADARPVKAHISALYIVRGDQRLREMKIEQYFNTNSGRDLSLLANHIAQRGFAQIVWDSTRNVLWIRLADGGLASYVYDVDNQVYGFTQHLIGDGSWTCEQLAIAPGAFGRNVLWMVASRSRPTTGAFQRGLFTISDATDQIYYDAASIYSGPPVPTVAGLAYLEGETVTALADGAEYPGLVVAGGEITLPNGIAAMNIWVGQPIQCYFESLPLDLGQPGTTLNKRTRLKQALVSLVGVEAQIGQDTGELDTVRDRAPAEGLAPIVKALKEKVTFSGETGRDPRIVVSYFGGYPLEIHALQPMADASD
jgi:hypothetical protein